MFQVKPRKSAKKSNSPRVKVGDSLRLALTPDLSTRLKEAAQRSEKSQPGFLRDALIEALDRSDEERFSSRFDVIEKAVESLTQGASKAHARTGDLFALLKSIEADQISRETAFRESLAVTLKTLSQNDTAIRTLVALSISMVHGSPEKGVRRAFLRAVEGLKKGDNAIQLTMLNEIIESAK